MLSPSQRKLKNLVYNRKNNKSSKENSTHLFRFCSFDVINAVCWFKKKKLIQIILIIEKSADVLNFAYGTLDVTSSPGTLRTGKEEAVKCVSVGDFVTWHVTSHPELVQICRASDDLLRRRRWNGEPSDPTGIFPAERKTRVGRLELDLGRYRNYFWVQGS